MMHRRIPLLVMVTLTAYPASGELLHNMAVLSLPTTTVPVNNFSYSGAAGPLAWAALNPANFACNMASSTTQPVNLDSSINGPPKKPYRLHPGYPRRAVRKPRHDSAGHRGRSDNVRRKNNLSQAVPFSRPWGAPHRLGEFSP